MGKGGTVREKFLVPQPVRPIPVSGRFRVPVQGYQLVKPIIRPLLQKDNITGGVFPEELHFTFFGGVGGRKFLPLPLPQITVEVVGVTVDLIGFPLLLINSGEKNAGL